MRAWFLILALVWVPRPSIAFFCAGDCDGDGEVSVDQVLILVNIALESAPVSSCTAGDGNGDGTVTIDEIILALGHALTGCPGPRIAGTWLEDQFRLTSSTCSAAATDSIRNTVMGLPACQTVIRVIGAGQISGTDCSDRTEHGSVDVDGIMSFQLAPSSISQSGCTITQALRVVIDARSEPATARSSGDLAFAGTCTMPRCSVVIESRWTLQD